MKKLPKHMKEDREFLAYLRGCEARRKGDFITDNPYKTTDDRLFELWHKGWLAEDLNFFDKELK